MLHVQNWPSPQIHYLYANRQYPPPPKLLCARQLSLFPRWLFPAHMHWLCLLAWRLLFLPQPCHLPQRLPCTHQLYPSARLGPSARQPSPMHQCHHLVEQLHLDASESYCPSDAVNPVVEPHNPNRHACVFCCHPSCFSVTCWGSWDTNITWDCHSGSWPHHLPGT